MKQNSNKQELSWFDPVVITQLEGQESTAKKKHQSANCSIEPNQADVEFLMQKTDYSSQEAKKALQLHNNNLTQTLINFITSFEQQLLYRDQYNVLGP